MRPNRVEIAGASRSGLSATLGLAMVVGLLLIGGTLAVSGGGILNSGGRLGVEPGASPSAGTGSAGARGSPEAGAPTGPAIADDPGEETKPAAAIGHVVRLHLR